jgi:hypothetical protein
MWVTRRAYRQVFEPYLNPEGPIFVTSDAMLAAYHTLMNASFERFEQLNAQRLPGVLMRIWSGFSDQRQPSKKESQDASGTGPNRRDNQGASEFIDTRQTAERYARFVLAVALKLLDKDPVGLETDLQQPVEDALKRIRSGSSPGVSADRATAVFDLDAMDAARFVPIGFYGRSANLQRYFQAIRWLQTVPFRIERDAELLAILMLGKAVSSTRDDNEKTGRNVDAFFRCYRDLIGGRYDRDVMLAGQIVRERPADLNMVRAYLGQIEAEESRREYPKPPAAAPLSKSPLEPFTMLPSARRTERRLFDTLFGGEADRPTGIALCAALGSTYARREWTRRKTPKLRDHLLAVLDRMEPVSPDTGLHDQYLSCAAALLDPVEPDAPLFLSTDAWEMKSCNAFLAGWVQAGHGPRLRPTSEEGPGADLYGAVPEGFVEPEPEFFARLEELVERTREIFERCSVFVAPRRVLAGDLRRFADLMQQRRYPPPSGTTEDLSSIEKTAIERSYKILAVIGQADMPPTSGETGDPATIAAIRSIAEDVENGRYDDDPTYQALIIETSVDLSQLWQILGQLCRRIEVMAHKQLRGVAFNERDTYFIADFGIRLATVMLHGGSVSHHPGDDFPVLHRMPSAGDGPLSYGAVGRPRELLVLYPFGGREILCRGAVVPYYEAELRQPLSNPEWIRRLDSDERPAAPHWFAPITAPGPIEKTWQK